MGWIEPLQGAVVGLDTAPLIYFIEKHQKYLPLVRPFFEAVERGEIEVVTSVLTLTEVMVHPLRHGNQTVADQYGDILLKARNVTTFAVSEVIATHAAQIRADYNLRTPDAIQLATAFDGRASAFLTNDAGLPSIPGLRLIQLDSLLP